MNTVMYHSIRNLPIFGGYHEQIQTYTKFLLFLTVLLLANIPSCQNQHLLASP